MRVRVRVRVRREVGSAGRGDSLSRRLRLRLRPWFELELELVLDQPTANPVDSFGFPSNYVAYRTGTVVGGQGIRPVVAFQPLPNPVNGAESEGPNDIAFAPTAFPNALANGVFVTFHGRFGAGGTNNEENPLVFVDLTKTNYFHVIPPKLPGIGHLDGLLATRQALFISDLSTNGGLSSGIGRGVIYRVQALVGPSLELEEGGTGPQLRWNGGVLQGATELPGPWENLAGTSPYALPPAGPYRFFRVRY